MKVSIIIPTYNRSKLIGKTLECVLNQTYSDIEVIVVNDNSSDDTKDVLDKHIQKDSRVKCIHNVKNMGAPAARNIGIKVSTGDLIALLDDDDEWLPYKLEKQVHLLESNASLGLVYCGFSILNKEKEVIMKSLPKRKGDIYYELLKQNFIGSPTCLIRKECFEKVGYCDETFKSCQDWDLLLRITKMYNVDYVPEVLAYYNLTDSCISNNLNSVIKGHEQILSKYKLDIISQKGIYGLHLRNISLFYAYKNDYKNASKYFYKSFKKNPLNSVIIVQYIAKMLSNHNVHYY